MTGFPTGAMENRPAPSHETCRHVPEGFVNAALTEPFLALVGPFYVRQEAGSPMVLGLYASDRHINRYGVVHGGMLSTLADIAIGLNISGLGKHFERALTLNLSVDFIGAAHEGDWIEVHVQLTKEGGRVRFGDCSLRVGMRVVARGHAVFYTPR